jgi:hypothetical protein
MLRSAPEMHLQRDQPLQSGCLHRERLKPPFDTSAESKKVLWETKGVKDLGMYQYRVGVFNYPFTNAGTDRSEARYSVHCQQEVSGGCNVYCAYGDPKFQMSRVHRSCSCSVGSPAGTRARSDSETRVNWQESIWTWEAGSPDPPGNRGRHVAGFPNVQNPGMDQSEASVFNLAPSSDFKAVRSIVRT